MLCMRKTFFFAFAYILAAAALAPDTLASSPDQRIDMRLDGGDVARRASDWGRDKAPHEGLVRERPSKQRLTVMKHSRAAGAAQRQRNPEMSNDMLVIVGLDAEGKEVGRQQISDPRLIRAETFSLDGDIETSDRFYRTDVEFVVFLPDAPTLSAVRVYQPSWNGRTFDLEFVDEAVLR